MNPKQRKEEQDKRRKRKADAFDGRKKSGEEDDVPEYSTVSYLV